MVVAVVSIHWPVIGSPAVAVAVAAAEAAVAAGLIQSSVLEPTHLMM